MPSAGHAPARGSGRCPLWRHAPARGSGHPGCINLINPIDLINFVDTVNTFSADFIMGSRFISNKRSVLHFWHMLGNKFITFVFNIMNNTTFTDIYCCSCLFKRKNLPILKLKSFGWGQQAEILTYLSSNSKKIYDIGVNYNARKYSEGKKIKYYHVFEIVYWILITKIRVLFN